MELHPLCTLFPRMAGNEFDALVADIKANGQREPIITHEGMILDGGNRYRACVAAGIEPNFMKFGGENLVAYVLSANLHRRHMSPGQQAAIVASAQDWAKAQTVGNPQFGNLTGLETVADRQAQSGASDKTQRNADKVAKADPVLAKKVARGEISLPAAVEKVTGKRPGARSFKAVPEELQDYDPLEDELKSALDTIVELSQENDALRDQIAVKSMDGTEEEKEAALETIKTLRAEIIKLEREIRAITDSRDSYMRENAEMKKQLKWQREQLSKLGKAAA